MTAAASQRGGGHDSLEVRDGHRKRGKAAHPLEHVAGSRSSSTRARPTPGWPGALGALRRRQGGGDPYPELSGQRVLYRRRMKRVTALAALLLSITAAGSARQETQQKLPAYTESAGS